MRKNKVDVDYTGIFFNLPRAMMGLSLVLLFM